MRRCAIGAVLLPLAIVAAGCAQVVADSSRCRNLPYKDGEVARAEYLPCAGEIVAALEELDRQTEAALGGDAQARSDGKAALRRVVGLMKAAGGRQLLERWSDRRLMDFNVDVHNAVTHYDAFYMVRIHEEGHQFAATSRQAARAEFDGARRRFTEASRAYRQMR